MIYELQNGPVSYDENRLSNLIFNPLNTSFNETIDQFTIGSGLDPDFNYYSGAHNCDYYTEDGFSAKLRSQGISNSLSFLHLNIRSLQRNFDNFSNLLLKININFTFIGLSETWLKDSETLMDIPGYRFIHNPRHNRTGGGVGLYFSDHLNFKLRSDLCYDDIECAESLFIEVLKPKGKNIVIGVVYRPPASDLNAFVQNTDTLITKIARENKICYLMGDFNINLLNYKNHELTNEFLDIMYSNMFFPLITRPTRITSFNATLIDNIFTNDLDNCLFSGLIFTDISDHLPVFSLLYIQDEFNKANENSYAVYREYNNENLQKFRIELANVNWMTFCGSTDPNNSYNEFLREYSRVFNSCFPLKKKTKKVDQLCKSWMTKGLLKSIKKKNNLYRKYLRKPTCENNTIYKNYKNKLNHSIRIAKRLYFENKLRNSTSNIKQTWQILNEVTNRKKSRNNFPSMFSCDNQDFSDPTAIANRFCEYFTNIGFNLAKEIPNSSRTACSYLNGNFLNSLFLNSVSKEEIVEIVNSFRSGAAPGYDNIPIKIVKNSIDLISEPLCELLNSSIISGIVPDQMKIARIVPIFKTGDNFLFSNYRPVSVLPVFSKVMEKVVYNRLLKYINDNNILFKNQYGFRKNYSTSHALINLYDKISSGIDANKHNIGIFLDLSKAFDTVDHEILISKLEHYGIRGVVLEWFRSYLSHRLQYVEYNGVSSLYKEVRCGVPQGSILGPLLFLIYINDISEVTEHGDFLLFADDTNLFYSHDNISSLTNIINSELRLLSDWFRANKLSINIPKSNYVIFKTRQKKQTFDLTLQINQITITRVNEVCFLGVILDENLTWKAHIAHVARKISKSIGIIYRSSFYLFKSALRMLYFALVYPYLQYCITVWGSTYASNTKRLVVLQKRVVRIVDKQGFGVHTTPIFCKYKLLKFEDIYFFELGKLIFKYQHECLPRCFENSFLEVNKIHNYATRKADTLYVPYCRTNIRLFSVNYQGPKFYNTLPSDICNSSCIYKFQDKLKRFFFSFYI